jgi:hypothetical protein
MNSCGSNSCTNTDTCTLTNVCTTNTCSPGVHTCHQDDNCRTLNNGVWQQSMGR